MFLYKILNSIKSLSKLRLSHSLCNSTSWVRTITDSTIHICKYQADTKVVEVSFLLTLKTSCTINPYQIDLLPVI